MKYDVVVIGGGPAGMMAAGRAGELGARVLLLEKNRRLGNKLLVTGKGRCNITNNLLDVRTMTDKFGKNGKFLFSALNSFGVSETIDFFENRGLEIKIERGERVFPLSDQSSDVLDTLITYLDKSSVEVRTNIEVKNFVKKEEMIEKIILLNGDEIEAEKYVIATGGLSYPGTGSTGDAYIWAEELGHQIVKPIPSLTPIVIKEKFVKELEGLSLKNVEISLYKNSKKIDSRFGEAIFTSNGMSGPIVLDISKKVTEIETDNPNLLIDFKPALDFVELDLRIQNDFREANNKIFSNSLDQLLPQKLIPVMIKLSGIDPDKKVNLVTKEERKKILHLLKEFSLEVVGVVGFSKSIVTSGGVALNGIDPKTMKSKIINNLYFAGELLDLDGPTGGFNLQVCWSTGYSAGNNLFKK
ncbi:MAG: NAD(P)/FAD-dependent oxidoreductase [Patescibacteria group bacterium]|jgi:predicted Rossmann fold flavoprotein|nr:NAD(P)/FAD-dependent oxidoreductase [Patescibacteria group bacterium]